MELLDPLLNTSSTIRFLFLLLLSGASALLVKILFRLILENTAKKTSMKLDDQIIKELRSPVFWTVFLSGAYYSILSFQISGTYNDLLYNLLLSTIIIWWGVTITKLLRITLKQLTKHYKPGEEGVIDDLLLFLDNTSIFIVGTVALLMVLSLWGIDVTPLLASAGVVGVAVAFAAKDMVANLFGGISIFLDHPYRVGDFVVIYGQNERYVGEVLGVGMRSTKIRTRDNVLLTIPNSTMITNAVINESGHDPRLRVRVPIGIEYKADLERVEQLLLKILTAHPDILEDESPRVRYREFGESAIRLEAMGMVKDPTQKARVKHDLIKTIKKNFDKEDINIPFPQREVHLGHSHSPKPPT